MSVAKMENFANELEIGRIFSEIVCHGGSQQRSASKIVKKIISVITQKSHLSPREFPLWYVSIVSLPKRFFGRHTPTALFRHYRKAALSADLVARASLTSRQQLSVLAVLSVAVMVRFGTIP